LRREQSPASLGGTGSTLRQLFDGVIEVDTDGNLTLSLPDAEPMQIER